MSSGSTIAYHLRQNKAIDRNLFVDLLMRVGRFRNVSDYEYIGFGGPFLEDFKILHSSLRLARMISIESNKEVIKRQEFNKPLSCIRLLPQTSGEFLTNHDFLEPSIVWLDYTAPRELPLQLAEVELLVTKLKHGDVFKITLNANPESLGKPNDGSDLREYRLAQACERLTTYAPADISADDVVAARYPSLLLRAVENAAKKGVVANKGCVVEPLSIFSYADGQQMLTITCIVISKLDLTKFYGESRLKHWPFLSGGWTTPRSISVPQLSTKERLHIESKLPDNFDAASINKELGYYVGESIPEAEKLMSNFVQYYRLYPWYSRVML